MRDDLDDFGYGRTGIYDSYDIDDEELDRIDRLERKRRKREGIPEVSETVTRSRFDEMKVLAVEEEETPKPRKKKPRNKKVREEEMNELIPGGTTDEFPVALPGEQAHSVSQPFFQ
jgi:hypothetical protein